MKNDSFEQAKAFRKVRGSLDLGEPTRLLVGPGDLFLLHERMPIALAPNMEESEAVIVTFELQHLDFEDLVDDYVACETPWVGFEGLQELV